MERRTYFIILVECFAIYWWVVYAYTRDKATALKAIAEAKYGAWDKAYKEALKHDLGQYYAVQAAVKAIGAGPEVLKLWQETYNKAVDAGIRTYSAGVKAAAAAREFAHKNK
jgi:hypothetical protein